MSNSFFMYFKKIFYFFVIFVLLICCVFIPVINVSGFSNNNQNGYSFNISNDKYLWPTPGYNSINSYFGKRSSPTAYSSSYHKGIDIGAPQGSSFIAVTSGTITFTGFLGGGGYTITLTSGSMKFTYCHVSPNYIVKKGDIVEKGDIIRTCWSKKCVWSKR